MFWLVCILATIHKDLRELFIYILCVLETQLLAYISSYILKFFCVFLPVCVQV